MLVDRSIYLRNCGARPRRTRQLQLSGAPGLASQQRMPLQPLIGRRRAKRPQQELPLSSPQRRSALYAPPVVVHLDGKFLFRACGANSVMRDSACCSLSVLRDRAFTENLFSTDPVREQAG